VGKVFTPYVIRQAIVEIPRSLVRGTVSAHAVNVLAVRSRLDDYDQRFRAALSAPSAKRLGALAGAYDDVTLEIIVRFGAPVL
jgi:hypothetical protein